jgi:glycine cleavage system H protein
MKKYSEHHVWVAKNSEGDFVMGVTQHAIDELGTVAFFEGDTIGSIPKDDSIGTIESNKTVADIHAPMDMSVRLVNDDIDYDKLNKDPENVDECWLFKIVPDDVTGFIELMDEEAYKTFCSK